MVKKYNGLRSVKMKKLKKSVSNYQAFKYKYTGRKDCNQTTNNLLSLIEQYKELKELEHKKKNRLINLKEFKNREALSDGFTLVVIYTQELLSSLKQIPEWNRDKYKKGQFNLNDFFEEFKHFFKHYDEFSTNPYSLFLTDIGITVVEAIEITQKLLKRNNGKHLEVKDVAFAMLKQLFEIIFQDCQSLDDVEKEISRLNFTEIKED